jgi:hypothetical protein
MAVKINLKLLITSLVFAMIYGIIFWFFVFIDSFVATLMIPLLFWSYVPELLLFIINPIAIFVVFYFIGKKLDLMSMLKGAIISIFIGLLIGFYPIAIAFIMIVGSLLRVDISIAQWYFLVELPATIQYVLLTFFVVFASLAIGYLRAQSNIKKETNQINKDSST